MYDIVFCTVPKVRLGSPLIGPAILKAAVENAGYSAKCLDLNIDLWHRLKGTGIDVHDEGDITFQIKEYYDKFKDTIFEKILDDWCHEILDLNARYVGFTNFSQRCEFVLTDLCTRLKKHDVTIVVGGPEMSLPPKLKEMGLIDYHVVGDGELTVVELLKGNFSAPGINDGNIQQLTDFSLSPTPDYRDYDFNLYPADFYDPDMKELGLKVLHITGSRGCVRACTFCDVSLIWKKFRFRDGNAIAQEMQTLYERHKVRHFYFTDSLLNGSLRLLEDLCQTLIQYQKEHNMKFKWFGQFICRPIEQMKPRHYDMMKEAGCQVMSVGIESGSETVRKHMKKQFSNKDLMNMVKESHRAGIRMNALLIVGYPTETEKDFLDTIQMMRNFLPYKDIFTTVVLGPTMMITHNTPLDLMREEIELEGDDSVNWRLGDNTRLVRLERWFRLRNALSEMKYRINEKHSSLLEEEYNKLLHAEKINSTQSVSS